MCTLALDIDECAEETDRCAQNCHNTIGSYTCSCNAGYRLNANGYDCDGMSCSMIFSLHVAIMLNIRLMLFGFVFSTDIDECAEQLDECQQICNNTIGSYVCDCRIGYALNDDGRTCRGKTDNNFRVIVYNVLFEFPFQILMSVHLILTAVIKTVTTILDHIRAAVMQVGASTLMDSAAMVTTTNPT